jgi:hypothetical protein
LLLLLFGEQTQKEAAPLFINYGPEQSAVPLDDPISSGTVMVLRSVVLVHVDPAMS